jgi:tetratricopeptide (TPR) repeat protein
MPGTFEQAVEHHRQGRWAEAERLYKEVLSGDPNHGNALFLSGAIALESGRAGDASELFRRATRIAPDNALYHANLGECHRRLGRPAEAMDAFLRALALKPDLVEPMFNLGRTTSSPACGTQNLALSVSSQERMGSNTA